MNSGPGEIPEAIGERMIVSTVRVNTLFLDPNNYRLAALEEYRSIADQDGGRISEDKALNIEVQEELRETIRGLPKYKSLLRSIKKTGGPIEPPIVVEINRDAYLVLEGNRRVACVKDICEEIQACKFKPLNPRAFNEIRVQIIPKDLDSLAVRRELLSMRHIVGPMTWGPYEQSCVIQEYINEGRNRKEIADLLGIPVNDVTKFSRAHVAYLQFEKETGIRDPQKFSLFQELVSKPKFKEYYDIDNEGHLISDDRYELYEWITPDENGKVKIPGAYELKMKLPKILNVDEAYTELSSDEGNLESAYQVVSMQEKRPSWQIEVRQAKKAIESIPGLEYDKIAKTPEEYEILTGLRDSLLRILKELEGKK